MLEEELRAAAARGNLSDVNALLKRGAKIVPPDSSGRTALHLAAAGGHTQVVEALVHPKFVNSTDGVGRTALQVAAAGGHVDVISVLLKNGANVNLRDNLHGNTALHEASWHGFSRSVALLAGQNKAELNTTNCAGFAALHLCCQNGHNQSCRELLLAGANPNVQNNYGDTSLHTSARYGHAGVARILISACCRVSDQNKNGDTSLHIAAAMGRRKMTTILLESGCDSTIRNKQYETALDIATRKDLNEIIIILKSVKPHKKKKKKKSSETSDSDKRSGNKSGGAPAESENNKGKNELGHRAKSGSGVSGESGGRVAAGWSPYGCHYYPDFSSFPSPKLDSLPGEPLGKGEQYFLDLAGNICKGPVGVGLTCHCANFLRDMEARLEKNNLELKQKIKLTRCRLEERVERTEGLLAEWLGGTGKCGDDSSHSEDEEVETECRSGGRPRSVEGGGKGRQSRSRLAVPSSGKRHHRYHNNRSQSLDLLHNCDIKQLTKGERSAHNSLDLIGDTPRPRSRGGGSSGRSTNRPTAVLTSTSATSSNATATTIHQLQRLSLEGEECGVEKVAIPPHQHHYSSQHNEDSTIQIEKLPYRSRMAVYSPTTYDTPPSDHKLLDSVVIGDVRQDAPVGLTVVGPSDGMTSFPAHHHQGNYHHHNNNSGGKLSVPVDKKKKKNSSSHSQAESPPPLPPVLQHHLSSNLV